MKLGKMLVFGFFLMLMATFVYTGSASGTPSATLAFFMSSEGNWQSDRGPNDGDDFSECPIQLNDYGETTEKCGLWDCTAWTEDAATPKQTTYCSGGWNCTNWNGVSCETYKCEALSLGATQKALVYCSGGWNCTNWNGGYCEHWNCQGWSDGGDKLDKYCDGVWNCTNWNGDNCEKWMCASWADGTIQKADVYCSGVWDCAVWNVDVCGSWGCTSWSELTQKADRYCADGWNCSAWNGDYCDKWKCLGSTDGATLEADYYCDRWNCSSFDETKEVCGTWECLEWLVGTAQREYYCSGVYNCTTWKIFCTENWRVHYTFCNTSNQRVKYYIDNNSCGTTDDLPGDNGTVESCNYCSENLIGPYNTSCNISDKLTQYYIDTNYGGCCAVTGLESDCHINNGTYNNKTLSCNYCAPDLVNTSWSDWHNITVCQANDTVLQQKNLTQYDNNSCGEANQTFYEYQSVACNYSGPSILDTSITPYAVINGSNIILYVSASNADSLWATILKPDSNEENMTLTNNANITFDNTTLFGRYNVTFYVNDSVGTIVNTTDYFESFPPTIFKATIIDYNSTGLNSTWHSYYRDEFVAINSSGTGNYSNQLADTILDLEFKAYTDRLQVLLRDINLSLNNNRKFGMDKHTTISGFLAIYGINSTYNFTNATVKIYYDDTAYTNENNLQLHKCNNYNFDSRTCSGIWTDAANQEAQNTTSDYFEITTASFSGFGIKQYTMPIEATNGGGGGGGGSRTWTPSTQPPKPTSELTHIPTPPKPTIESPQETLFDIISDLIKSEITLGRDLFAKISLVNFGVPGRVDVNLGYTIIDSENNTILSEQEIRGVETQTEFIKIFELPSDIKTGEYKLSAKLAYEDQEAISQNSFKIGPIKEKVKPYFLSFGGNSLLLIPILIIIFGVPISYILIKRLNNNKKIATKKIDQGEKEMHMTKEVLQKLKKNQNVIVSFDTKNYTKIFANLHKVLSKKFEKICLITTNTSSDFLVKKFRGSRIDTSKYYFIDSVSAKNEQIKDSKQHIYISSPESLTELDTTIQETVKNWKPELIIFDDISTLLLYNSELAVLRFLHNLITKIHLTNAKAVYLIMEEDLQKIIKNLVLFADAIMDLSN